MSALKGKNLLVGLGTAGSPLDVTLIRARRSVDITINDESVDVTQGDAQGWRALLEDAGIKTMSVSMDGVVESPNNVLDTLLAAASNGTFVDLVVCTAQDSSPEAPAGHQWSGRFQITSSGLAGTYNGEQTYAFTFESAGQIAYSNS